MNTQTETQLELNLGTPAEPTIQFAALDTKINLSPMKQNYKILFFKENSEVGSLDWNDGVMKFIGNADESAKLFFDNIIKRYFNDSPKPNTATEWKS